MRNRHARHEEEFETPFVEIEGTKYFSDRYYLNRTVLDPINPSSFSSSAYSLYNDSCACGARKPPPLFDREILVKSCDLKAAILGTYTIDISWMAKAFPKLCGPDATVPTLCLHGQKGLSKRLEKVLNSHEADDDSSDEEDVDFSTVPEEGWRKTQPDLLNPDEQFCSLGNNFYLSQVDSIWLPPKHRPPNSPHGSWRKMHPSAKAKRIRKKGVFHPKYMLLFEKDGGLIVVVSTSNLMTPSSTDGTWMQRFHPFTSSPKVMPKSCRRRNGCDFGAVLSDFLQQQSYATRDGCLLPEEFLKEFLNCNSLGDFEATYDWSTAQVHLIATCPGDYEGRFKTKHLRAVGNQREFLYSRQRVADIVSRLASETDEECPIFCSKNKWLPDSLMSERDRLLIQPTSFGANFRLKDLATIAADYLGYDEMKRRKRAAEASARGKRRQNNWQDHELSEQQLVEKLDIVWPSQRLIETISACKKRKRTASPRSVDDIGEYESLHGEARDSARLVGCGSLFMSSEAFNSTEMSCLSQLVLFEPSVPEQREPLAPHIKSLIRHFHGDVESLRNEFGIGRAEAYFSYFLLTSACLSHGAQGKIMEEPGRDKSTLSYANFELGVLFCSRLMGAKKSDRLYCWRPECSCPSYRIGSSRGLENRKQTLIHLPIPYAIHPRPYQLDKDEVFFTETPFFHEVGEMSGHIQSLTTTT